MSNNNGTFNYTYSANQKNEVAKIREKYISREENKMELLQRLDKSVKQPGRTASITIGTISSLFLGGGMALIMEWQNFFAVGMILGLIGLVGMSVAYPIYTAITKGQRQKIAPQIIKLTNELT